jgi:hypothetical protein
VEVLKKDTDDGYGDIIDKGSVVIRGLGLTIFPFSAGMAVRDSDGLGEGSDSDGFVRIQSSPAGHFFAVLYSLYGHFDSTEMGSGFGRIR